MDSAFYVVTVSVPVGLPLPHRPSTANSPLVTLSHQPKSKREEGGGGKQINEDIGIGKILRFKAIQSVKNYNICVLF